MQKVAEQCRQHPEAICTMQTSFVGTLDVPARQQRVTAKLG